MDAAAALGQAMLLRSGDRYAADLLHDLAVDGWLLVNIPTVEQAAEAIRRQHWDCEVRQREVRDAEAVLALVVAQAVA